ncbi:two-component system sensor histidine kinase CreC [Polaromonas sp. A23]|uniref:two-component system sensor histidine kinase CreC n=1 Tax=Polaromonas sp. A23 TaxID=1944133 RepID=UPI00098683DC|nr:two-component system sensor histidine kinase CreC [Polaromonas sp. A23]OOG46230.1 two-component system sensor histidine kinase CreC [Polaromonas sp. A23]
MRLGIRLLFGFFLVTGLAAFFVLRVFMAEVKPSVREVMEDMMVDTANILAELASDDLATGHMADGRFAQQVRGYARRPIDVQIWGLAKQSLDFRVYVTDIRGTVMFDSENAATGQDYSRWRDVARTLRGEYGARATREIQHDDRTSIMYVAAPVTHDGKTIGVLTVAKPVATIQAFIDRAERKIFLSGLLLLALSLAIGVAVTLWVVWSIRKLRHYANAVGQGAKPAVPQIPGELGELALAVDAMRRKLEGHEYIEGYVRALTHELKSPLAAIRGAGELLQDELPENARREFAGQVLGQTGRLQALVDRMLELTKLEQRHAQLSRESLPWVEFLKPFAAIAQAGRAQHTIKIIVQPEDARVHAEPGLLSLALSNLLENARSFAPAGSVITIEAAEGMVAVQDGGDGVADYALPRLGERFFSTVRPDGLTKGSGLGLAIVRQIMALHGGRMEVRNTHPGLRVELHF